MTGLDSNMLRASSKTTTLPPLVSNLLSPPSSQDLHLGIWMAWRPGVTMYRSLSGRSVTRQLIQSIYTPTAT